MKKLLFIILLSLFSSHIYAQSLVEEYTGDGEERVFWTSWKANWFLGASVGFESKLESPELEGFNLKTTPAFDVSFGKWINPFIGLQFKWNITPIRGTSELANMFKDSDDNLGGYLSTAHLDLMFDLCAIIGGYKKDRTYRFCPYIGAGMSMPHGDDGSAYTKDYVTWGIVNSFRITDRVGIKSTIRTSTSNAGHYGVSEDAIQRHRIYPVSITVGFVYRFKNKGYKTPSPRVITEYIAADTVYMQPDLSQYRPDTVFVEKVVKEKDIVFAGSVIRFELNSSKLSLMSRVNLSYIAKAIKAMPGKVFNVIGHCDVHTGSV